VDLIFAASGTISDVLRRLLAAKCLGEELSELEIAWSRLEVEAQGVIDGGNASDVLACHRERSTVQDTYLVHGFDENFVWQVDELKFLAGWVDDLRSTSFWPHHPSGKGLIPSLGRS
jgi:hypothetical protein